MCRHTLPAASFRAGAPLVACLGDRPSRFKDPLMFRRDVSPAAAHDIEPVAEVAKDRKGGARSLPKL